MKRLREGVQALRAGIGLIVPIVLAFLVVGVVVLYGYAPPYVVSHYTSPRSLISGFDTRPYAAIADKAGWDVAEVDSQDHMILARIAPDGSTVSRRVIDSHGLYDSDPALSRVDGRMLMVWSRAVGQRHSGIRAAFVTDPRPSPFWLVAPRGFAGHATIVQTPNHRFDVLYSRMNGPRFQIWMRRVNPANGKISASVRLVHSGPYDFMPRGAFGGDGNLDVLYMQECCQTQVWLVKMIRFSAGGSPLGPATIVGRVAIPSVSDTEWAMDLERAKDGSVWGGWETVQTLRLGHWSPTGKELSVRVLQKQNLDQVDPALSLVLNRGGGGGSIFFGGSRENSSLVVETRVMAERFNQAGRSASTEPVEQLANTVVAYPRAGLGPSGPQVIWENSSTLGHSHVLLQSADYTRHPPPASLSVRLGLGAADPILNAGLLLVGAVFAAIPITIVNFLIFVPLMLLWIPASRLRGGRAQWALMGIATAAILTAVFAAQTRLSSAALLISPFKEPFGWIVVAGAVFVGSWIAVVSLRNQEPVVRVALMALTSVYFIAFMWAAVEIQSLLVQQL